MYGLITLLTNIFCWLCFLGAIGYGFYRLFGGKKLGRGIDSGPSDHRS